MSPVGSSDGSVAITPLSQALAVTRLARNWIASRSDAVMTPEKAQSSSRCICWLCEKFRCHPYFSRTER